MTHATLGIDGNCGFALLGENLQEGESEFEVIACSEPEWSIEWREQARMAINRAFKRLKARLGVDPMPYYISESHPDHC